MCTITNLMALLDKYEFYQISWTIFGNDTGIIT